MVLNIDSRLSNQMILIKLVQRLNSVSVKTYFYENVSSRRKMTLYIIIFLSSLFPLAIFSFGLFFRRPFFVSLFPGPFFPGLFFHGYSFLDSSNCCNKLLKQNVVFSFLEFIKTRWYISFINQAVNKKCVKIIFC